MSHPDYERAFQYALERLEHGLAPEFVYHNVGHTRDDVVPAVERLANMAGVFGESLELLQTAAYYHDIGFVEHYAGQEEIGVRIAAEVLPGFGYDPRQVQVVCDIIWVTRLPQTPHTQLEELMADADLDVLGRDDFWIRNQALRSEKAACGVTMSDQEWYNSQLELLRKHHYFTAPARELRDAGKQQHIEQLWMLIEKYA